MKRAGPPLRYAGWMARDTALGVGLAIGVIAALTIFGMSRIESTVTATTARLVASQVLRQSLFPLVLVATAGIVSGDLVAGYYRAWFSRPVSPPLFYLQKWLIAGAAILAYVPIISLAVAIRPGTVEVNGEHLAKAGLLYLLVGGTVFLLSTLTRRDWLFAALLFVTETVLHFVQSHGAQLGLAGRAIYWLLPPYHVAALEQPMPSGGDLWTALAYGAGLVMAALAVLHWRPLGAGGRA